MGSTIYEKEFAEGKTKRHAGGKGHGARGKREGKENNWALPKVGRPWCEKGRDISL